MELDALGGGRGVVQLPPERLHTLRSVARRAVNALFELEDAFTITAVHSARWGATQLDVTSIGGDFRGMEPGEGCPYVLFARVGDSPG